MAYDLSLLTNMRTIIPTVSFFRPFSGVFLAVASFFMFATPTFAYEEDTHFLMTYILCKSVGFTDKEALMVAAVDQGMDDSKATNAHDGAKTPH